MDAFDARLVELAARFDWTNALVERVRLERDGLAADPTGVIDGLTYEFHLESVDRRQLHHLAEALRPRDPALDHPPAPDWAVQDSYVFLSQDEPTYTGPTAETSLERTGPFLRTTRSVNRTLTGSTFSEVFSKMHAAAAAHPLGDVVAVFAGVAAAAASVHSYGGAVLCLSPGNVLIGDQGETLVADPDAPPELGYSAPEQVRTGADPGPRADVFALGVLLFEALSGQPMFDQVGRDETLIALLENRRRELTSPWEVPESLRRIVDSATHPDPVMRYPHGAAFVCALQQWTLHSGATEGEGPQTARELANMRAEATRLRREAADALTKLPLDASVEDKQSAWLQRDEAAYLLVEAERAESALIERLSRELSNRPDAVRRELGSVLHGRHRHLEVEGRDTTDTTRRIEALDPERFKTYLAGDGKLTLEVDPEGAQVDLYQFHLDEGRLQPVFLRSLGAAPINGIELPMGRYLCVIRHPHCGEARYPVVIHRRTHWHGKPPGQKKPGPINLIRLGHRAPHAEYVPQGWFRCGGPEDAEAAPPGWVWCRGFQILRDPVSMRDYLEFLDELAKKRDSELAALTPRLPGGMAVAVLKGMKHQLQESGPASWKLDWPVAYVDWRCAAAYGRWYSARTGQKWRLPADVEWEKAARGVDGRKYPWGDRLDPLFARYAAGVDSSFGPDSTDLQIRDVSPYGVRGMAGNVSEWCRDDWQSRHAIAAGHPPPPVTPDGTKVVRGGNFRMNGAGIACWNRTPIPADTRAPWLGFRLIRRVD